MFSYRHAFHAGNHADVLKHLVLIHSVQYLQEKDAAVMLVDTHAVPVYLQAGPTLLEVQTTRGV